MTSTFRIRRVNRLRAGAGRWREDDLLEGVLAPARRPGATAGTGGRDWLHSRLYACRELHDTLLAERVPAVLESLPAGVDRWFFLRPSDPDPHLRLSFGGDAPAGGTRTSPGPVRGPRPAAGRRRRRCRVRFYRPGQPVTAARQPGQR